MNFSTQWGEKMEVRRQKHNILHMSMLNIRSLCKMKVQVFYFEFETGAKSSESLTIIVMELLKIMS